MFVKFICEKNSTKKSTQQTELDLKPVVGVEHGSEFLKAWVDSVCTTGPHAAGEVRNLRY